MKKTVLDLRGAKPGELMIQIPAFDGNETWVKIESVKMAPKGQYTILLSGGLSYNVDENTILDVFQTPTLTPKKNFKTPRLVIADAYTIGSHLFASDECKEKSTYYITFRKKLCTINPELYDKDNDKMILTGGQKIIDHFFREPVTHAEIDEALLFLKDRKVTTHGLTEYSCPEQLWRDVVEKYNGYPPIEIKGLPEGSVIYPNEPGYQLTNLADKSFGFGEFAAWFESKTLQAWAATEARTQDTHWRSKFADKIQKILQGTRAEALAIATNMVQDFGDRAGMNYLESEILGMTHLYTWGGTDTFAGAYQAFKNGAKNRGVSVSALAHRNIQGYKTEADCFWAMYNSAKPGEITSNVVDCYDTYIGVEQHLLPIALESKSSGKNVITIARLDSGNAEEQATWICRLAKRHGLYEEVEIAGKTWYKTTLLKYMPSNGMDYVATMSLFDIILELGFLPWESGAPFGIGGGLRDHLHRDDISAKFALNAKGINNEGVVKFSDELGKTTLPGPFKMLRTPEALAAKKTIIHIDEPGEDAMEIYYTGNGLAPFGPAMEDDFEDILRRGDEQFEAFPGTLWTEENHGYPASDKIRAKRIELLKKHTAGSRKRAENY